MTLEGEESNLVAGSLELEGTSSPPPPPRNEGVPPSLPDVCVGEVIVLGSRTLIVTSLRGVRLRDGSPLAVSDDWDEICSCGGVVGALAGPGLVGLASSLSADMLLL